MVIKAYTLAKPNEPNRQSEDRYWINTDVTDLEAAPQYPQLIIALSDGAGGVGLFAGEWAQYLIDQAKIHWQHEVIQGYKELENWLGSIWEPFFLNMLANPSLTESQRYKFEKHGACATLLLLWQVGPTSFVIYTVGDTCMHQYRGHDTLFVTPIQYEDPIKFAEPPYLISLLDPLEPQGPVKKNFELQPGQKALFATDALSEFIIQGFYHAKTASESQSKPFEHLQSQEEFEALIHLNLANLKLRSDDYTLITLTA